MAYKVSMFYLLYKTGRKITTNFTFILHKFKVNPFKKSNFLRILSKFS